MRSTSDARKVTLPAVLAVLVAVSTFGGYLFKGYRVGEGSGDVATLRVAETLSLLEFGDVESVFKVGFDSLELDGIWMNARESLLAFRAEGSDGQLEAVFEVVPLTGGARSSLDLYSQTLGDWFVHQLVEGLNEIRVPLPRQEVHSIAFACGKLASPSELGINSDTRPLCVKFVSVRLVRVSSEPGTGLQ